MQRIDDMKEVAYILPQRLRIGLYWTKIIMNVFIFADTPTPKGVGFLA